MVEKSQKNLYGSLANYANKEIALFQNVEYCYNLSITVVLSYKRLVLIVCCEI